MRISPKMYRAITVVALPLASLYLMWRSRRQPAYRRFWNERFAWTTFPRRTEKPRVWIHAVSVGETNAARPLIAEILRRWEDCDVLLTHMTPTGREAGEKLVKMAPGRIQQCYLPYDAPYAVEKFFRQARPTLGVIMETEVWPNLLMEAARLGIPMVLANARESEKSMKKAEKYIDVMKPAFESFSVILAQSEADKERLERLGGADVRRIGSLKFDITPNASQQALAQVWREAIGRPCVLFASTRKGEEAMIAPHLAENAARLGKPLYWVVPRHPQRFDEVFSVLEGAGLKVQRRSALREPSDIRPDMDVVLGDSMGEMSFYCALSDSTVMGGSFGDFGSQNVIEPAMAGSPVVVGPSIYNFEAIIEAGAAAGAMVRVKDVPAAFDELARWTAEPAEHEEAARRARAFADEYAGATARIMEVLEDLWQASIKRESRTS